MAMHIAGAGKFQSTLPAWGETARMAGWMICSDFNPLSPHGERPSLAYRGTTGKPISIHSPRMGRDGGGGKKRGDQTYFNPLSPHGERPQHRWKPSPQQYFNPLSPHGERRSGRCTPGRCRPDFNPLSPHGERHLLAGDLGRHVSISIHSPRMGRDVLELRRGRPDILFQSTLPAWGETKPRCSSFKRS